MKKLDSYRLLDLILMAICCGLGIIFTFMISLGYDQIANYFEEIKNFPYFVAFLPSLASSLIHAIINLFAAKRFQHNLIDTTNTNSKKQGATGFYIAGIATVITLIFVILFLTGTIYSEEYLYVLAALPMGVAPFLYFLFIELTNIAKSKRFSIEKWSSFILIFLLIAPIILGFATYFPGVLGWSYLGICFIPLTYLVGDSVSMNKEDSEIENLDDL